LSVQFSHRLFQTCQQRLQTVKNLALVAVTIGERGDDLWLFLPLNLPDVQNIGFLRGVGLHALIVEKNVPLEVIVQMDLY